MNALRLTSPIETQAEERANCRGSNGGVPPLRRSVLPFRSMAGGRERGEDVDRVPQRARNQSSDFSWQYGNDLGNGDGGKWSALNDADLLGDGLDLGSRKIRKLEAIAGVNKW